MAFKREERRVASGEAEGAIYNDASSCVDYFFKPVSQRECTTWRIVNSTLSVGTYSNKSSEGENATDGSSTLQSARRVAGFDLDSTLITTESGNIHAVDAKDWKWWHNSVPEKLKSLHNNGYSIVIFTNQAGLEDPKKDSTIVTKFKIKVAAILDALDIPLKLYAATARDDYRKPRTGMWYEMLRSYQLSGAELDLAASFLVGDAAGREGDHSDSDRLMAPARSKLVIERRDRVLYPRGVLLGFNAEEYVSYLSWLVHIPTSVSPRSLSEPVKAFH